MDLKLNQEELNNILQNAIIASQSISSIVNESACETMTEELKHQYDGYQDFISKITKYMIDNGYTPKDINVMKKAMLTTSCKINTLTDGSCSHIAEIMVKGTVMGITELRELITRGQDKIDQEIINYANTLLQLEENYERRLKALI